MCISAGIHSVMFDEQCQHIVAMCSLEGEIVPFRNPVRISSHVEVKLVFFCLKFEILHGFGVCLLYSVFQIVHIATMFEQKISVTYITKFYSLWLALFILCRSG